MRSHLTPLASFRPARLTRLLALGLAAALTSPLLTIRAADAAAVVAAKTAPEKFKVTYTRADPPELSLLDERVTLLNNQYKSGVGSKEELMQLMFTRDRMLQNRPYLLTIHSEGGTLRELLAAFSVGREPTLTVINGGESSDLDIPVPAFDLRNAHWLTVIEVISNFVATRGLLLKTAGSDNDNPNASASITCVMRRAGGADGRQAGEPAFEAFQLTDYIVRDKTVDDDMVQTITEAIRAGWAIVPGADQSALRLKYHPETRLLLVSGPAPAVQVAKQVIAGLPKKKPANP